MKSPFPGMDPYLEQFWLDLHARLILYACDQLEDQLPGNLIARVEERIVFIVEYHGDPATETFINILEAGPRQRLVTVIELLSLSNKLPGEGQQQYRQKQRELRDSRVSLVEIDLLRRGQRVLSLAASRIPRRVRTTYQVCVRRGWLPSQFAIYPVPLRSPLPPIRIPLREKDQDIRLDLQAVLEQAYRKGRYHLTVDYNEPPDPPLEGNDAKWARTLVKKARKGGE